MDCPRCKDNPLHSVILEDHLEAESCHNCGGHWLGSENYYRWLDDRGEILPEKPPEVELEVNDSDKAKLCPRCRRIMLKYKVGRGTDFYLDRCGSCNGVWFDKNEWESLKTRNLHDEVHLIFSPAWQENIRRQSHAKTLDRLYEQKFGTEDYEEVKKIRAWLRDRPQRLALLSFLTDKNPYQI